MKSAFVYAIGLVLLMSSCIKRVDTALPYEGNKLVINSLIQPDSVIYIRINRSVATSIYDEAIFGAMVNADVVLEEDGKALPTPQIRQIKGQHYFVSAEKAVLGKQYTIRASAAGMQPVAGTDTLPVGPQAGMPGAQRNSNRVRFTLSDDVRGNNFYRVRVFACGPDMKPDTLRLFRLDPTFNNNLIEFFTGSSYSSLIMSDERFNGKTVTFVLQTDDPIVHTSYMMVEVSTLTYNSYKYLRTIASQITTGNSIIIEPVRVFTNITNGYGIVGGINTQRMTFKVE
ncbi:DUF4249 domain-containing protein [Chitinophaga nivalis]|uniref:DUF4249 domain-containing protein n=1 Tax=Chitinophaga nivalis TaxID=2991709 RepID=A0ABT3IT90_9BACT|nr:DUF4249 domain-containing protein [Chitinophaga nivalis]MCW3463106.1 DUF4249 domain-containing protein [Chitinophaga nivalis]MCW3487204.1 DUF4249 domain-containing protein [Chitinophaga nivalis]